jgi:hypothetical protein
MAIGGQVGRWATAVAALASLIAGAFAGPARAAWPAALPAQPLVQAPRVCAPGIVPLNRRCHVVDFAPLGAFKGRNWYYAFYDTHWADRHGHHDRGFPVIFYLEQPATLRLSLWVDDAPGLAGRWALTAPARPVLIRKPDGSIYLGFTLKAVEGPDDQRLFRLAGLHWRIIDILDRSTADQARLDAATPVGCTQASNWRYDWTAFQLRAPLKADLGGPCGTIVAGLAAGRSRVSLTTARLIR